MKVNLLIVSISLALIIISSNASAAIVYFDSEAYEKTFGGGKAEVSNFIKTGQLCKHGVMCYLDSDAYHQKFGFQKKLEAAKSEQPTIDEGASLPNVKEEGLDISLVGIIGDDTGDALANTSDTDNIDELMKDLLIETEAKNPESAALPSASAQLENQLVGNDALDLPATGRTTSGEVDAMKRGPLLVLLAILVVIAALLAIAYFREDNEPAAKSAKAQSKKKVEEKAEDKWEEGEFLTRSNSVPKKGKSAANNGGKVGGGGRKGKPVERGAAGEPEDVPFLLKIKEG